MGDAPQGAGWWQATDGRWYPPEQHPNRQPTTTPAEQVDYWLGADGRWCGRDGAPVPERPTTGNTSRTKWPLPLVILLAVFLVPAVLFALAAGLSVEDMPDAPKVTSDTESGSTTLDDDDSEALCSELPQGCTPQPTKSQAAAIEDGVAAVYPGVPAGMASDWAVSVCSDIRAGKSEFTVLRNIQVRFAGGTRPVPTVAQAQQILEVVESVGFCTDR